ncbi:MAG: dihydropteroate synthase, partial [Candidatus Omnitrophica bacterium]|nr:dihydropteroate synthase [Candidatus Omnitrophota bacterium]
KALQAELAEGRMTLVRQLAKDQEARGALLLDINAGVAGIDEKKTLVSMIGNVSGISGLPLVIDSSNHRAIEAALKVYPGRALINSVSGEKIKLRKILPLARKYGAMVIALPIDEKGIPRGTEKRKRIVQTIIKSARRLGIRKEDIVIDGLALAVSSDPASALETMKMITWAQRDLGMQTVVGLSNISFGLPKRPWMNAAYLVMLQSEGLTMAFLNPFDSELMGIKRAVDVLNGRDKDAGAYIAYAAGAAANGAPIPPVPAAGGTPAEKIARAIMEGNRDDIVPLVDQAMQTGADAYALVDAVMIPALNRVGELFDKKEYFLPQLIASAETMEKAFGYLEKYLKRKIDRERPTTVVILATVKGDIHDIGKNIVGLLLKNHGFNVVDLGKDVSAEAIIREVKRYKSSVVGLSALMTTTMVSMQDVVERARKEKLACRFILGGAVVTKAYASSLGAEYAGDGVEAVKVVKRLAVSD